MNFKEELIEKQKYINDNLYKLFKDNDAPKLINEAINYSLEAGGKRIRPILAISVCESLGGKVSEILPFAIAIELIHTYSLIHDDLPAMDDDDLRRGKLTNHKVYGDAIAILAGDGLLNYAYEYMISETKKMNFEPRFIEALNIIATSAGINGMVGGQVIDILSEDKEVSIEMLYKMHRKKTGALIKAPCLAGCLIAKAENKYSVIDEYSENLGIAFQIVDDILDYTGDTQKMGKKTGVDTKKNKTTFVKLYGLERSKELALKYSEKAMELAKEIDKTNFLFELTEYLLKRDN